MATAFVEETRFIVAPVKGITSPLGDLLAQDLRLVAVTFAALPAVVASAVPDDYLKQCIDNACDDVRRLLDTTSPQDGHPRYMARYEFDQLCALIDVVGYTWASYDEALIGRNDLLRPFAGMAFDMLRMAGAA